MEALPLSLVVRASSTKLRDLPGIDELRELEGLFAGRTLISFEAEARETVRGALDRAGVSSTVPLRMVEPLRAPRIADTLIPVTPNFGYRGEQGLNAGDLLDRHHGEDVTLGVVELAWPEGSDDRHGVGYPIERGCGANPGHAVMTLSVLLGDQRTKGMSGLCPKAHVVPRAPSGAVDTCVKVGQTFFEAVADIGKVLPYGSVLLLEAEAINENGARVPATADPQTLEAVIALRNKGILVIIPAGNDRFPLAPPNRDWGGVVVGMCEPDMTHEVPAPHGRTVWAHGRGVLAYGLERGGPDVEYDGTSAAAAIIAGTAVIAQQMAQNLIGRPLQPQELIRLLTDSAAPRLIHHPNMRRFEALLKELR